MVKTKGLSTSSALSYQRERRGEREDTVGGNKQRGREREREISLEGIRERVKEFE